MNIMLFEMKGENGDGMDLVKSCSLYFNTHLMGEQYFKGVLAGYLGANFMCGPITEWQIDYAKAEV